MANGGPPGPPGFPGFKTGVALEVIFRPVRWELYTDQELIDLGLPDGSARWQHMNNVSVFVDTGYEPAMVGRSAGQIKVQIAGKIVPMMPIIPNGGN